MHISRRSTRARIALLTAPFLLFGAVCAQAVPEAAPVQQVSERAPATSSIQLLSMEFRHPVADGTLMRMIWLVDAPAKNALSSEELTTRGIDPNSFIPCLGEFVGKEYTDGRNQDIRERYVPWTPELEASLHALIAERNLTAENDYGARAETVTNPAYNIVLSYKDGHSLYITAAGETVNGHEADIEDILLTWCDEAFAAKGK